MNRVLPAVVLAASTLCAPAWGRDEEKGRFSALQKEFLTKYGRAEDAKAKAKLVDEYAPRFFALAEVAKGQEAVAPVNFLMQLSALGKKPEWRKKATDLIRIRIKEPGVADYFGALSAAPDEAGVALLTEVLDANPDKVIRAKAAKALVRANEGLGRMAKAVASEAGRKQLVEQFGEAHVKYLEANAKAFAERAFEFKELLATKFEGVLPSSPSVGKPVPEVVSKDLEGKSVKLSDYKGKVVVLDIWATWCPPCRAMIPHERELVKRLKDQPFVLISVSLDKSVDVLKAFLKDNEMPWVHWFNGAQGGLAEDWDVQAIPAIYVVDHKGVVRFTGVRGQKMDEAVDQLLKEMEDDKKNQK